MIKITTSRRVCLARMVIPLGNRRDGPTKPTSWTWLPASKGNEFQIEIPVKLIEEILAKKRAQLASAPPAPLSAVKPPSPPQPVQLMLARVIVPLKTPPERKEGHRCGLDAPKTLTPDQPMAAEEIRKRLLTAAFGVMNVMTAGDKPPVKGATTNVPTFTINDDNNINVYNGAQQATQAGDSTALRFDSQAALRKISAAWPLSRLVEIWNSIPGQREVHTFANRAKAVARIWTAIQALGKNGSASDKGAPVLKESGKKTPADRKRRVAKRQAVAKLSASANGPGNPRGYIGGQMYGIGYQLATQPANYVSNPMNYVSVLAFDKKEVPETPTWYGDIQTIFTQYANLYPIMGKYVVDLSDYDAVVQRLKILRLAFSLPIEDPNHMPVTRDLGKGDRKTILKWLDMKGADGLPPLGTPEQLAASPAPAVVDHSATGVELLPGQTAGKTAVILNLEQRAKAAAARGKEPQK